MTLLKSKITWLIVGLLLAGIGGAIFFIPSEKSGSILEEVRSLFPGGDAVRIPSAGNSPSRDGRQSGGFETEQGIIPSVRQVSAVPVSGATVFLRGGSQVIRYVERTTGNVFETGVDSLATTRISNMTVPRIQESLWFGKGEGVLLRYLDGETIKTFSAKIATSTEGGRLQGSFLPDDIAEIAVNPAGTKIFYLQEAGSGSIGTLADPDGGRASALFSSPLREWLLSWGSENKILFTTKPSAEIRGAAYTFDINTKSFVSVLGDVAALTASISPDGKTFFYSSAGDEIGANLLSGGKTTESVLSTFADKCVWSGSQKLLCGTPFTLLAPSDLEAWYRGEIALSDALWTLNTTLNIAELESAFGGFGDMDITHPLLSPFGTHFLFINKNDLTLWSVEVEKATTTPNTR